MQDISIWGAFIAGLLSFVSPCVLPLVPPYLAFLAGVSMDQLTGTAAAQPAGAQAASAPVQGDGTGVFMAALAFVLGFSTVFVTLGASASVIGQFVSSHIQELGYIAGAVIIIMGLHFLGVFRIPLLYREARFHLERKPAGLVGAYVIGLAFAFGWTPCVGPILAAILFVAGSEDTVFQGALLLGSYSLGIGVPFLAAAVFAGPFMRFMGKFRRHMVTVERAMGVLLIITGVAFLTGQMANLSFWLLETFPVLSVVG
ncbi:cytochrome c biogenesis CcdA family protein [Breoghania sp. L-A4]|uniref:cytochrome c biogenesis CcdA family protein n=1 Tax=Breoghania sp. L-A4 TaxID=2304600 RepID=UPI000E35F1E5|nr:cytochrome c biogenesis CcdA family protein [Breoghania sp. L-A4]AXS40479.1 cytochrome c biogenesis protein CcdA [Breoghania sp. L-A4]